MPKWLQILPPTRAFWFSIGMSTKSPLKPRTADTPAAFVQAILRAYRLRGLSPDAALHKAQIAPHQWRGQNPRAAAGVTALQFERLCEFAMRELDDEAPAWFRRRLPWGSYGMLARASHSAPTLGLALGRWCRHHGLLTDDVRLQLRVQDGLAELRIHERLPPSAPREFALLSLLRNAHGLACWWVDSQIGLQQAAFPHPAPAHAAVYARLFPGPVVFDAACALLRFDAHYLDLPLRRSDSDLDQMLARALPLMVRPYRRDRLLALRVRQLLQHDLGHTAESLAAALALSTRSLHRQLAAEHSSVQALKNEQRQARALHLLGRTHRPIKQIAREAGFAHEKSFARAFRSWVGQSPEQYRQSQTRMPTP